MKTRDVSGTQQGYLLHREQIGLQMGTQAMDGLTKGLQGPGALGPLNIVVLHKGLAGRHNYNLSIS